MDEDKLKRSHDRKTANRANMAGKMSLLKNAFSLPSGKNYSCPGATSVCDGVCYAGKLEKQYPAFRNLALHNWELLKDASYGEMQEMLTTMINEFVSECDQYKASKVFRWHADGDIFSSKYAWAIRYIAFKFPDVQFWIYTRSFQYVKFLKGARNLSVYLSVDSENESEALKTRESNSWVRLAYLSETHEDSKEFMLTNTGKPGAICPENAKRIPLITENGGACVTCGLCIFGKADIRFASKVPKRRK
ncbi:hypothetical protein SEA_TOMAS_266 [Streptomyces phage Tomas]|uniref:Gene product 88 domain-containing protein n=1 Tax=Streptomyces phage Tomas TaxID=2914443 RepID=A0AA49H1N3_9CAUD|nr:hypothetical protein PP453_gp010 [Streptomyces phage Tomas]YP_010651348.1 hypothetical protein PP453_gp058 [Streptomyces phage Tomas]UMO76201.1 hypothetical protein SEA_TOMAS_10 [Streptomyces phage Tomas]UMO76409.1 hypothetical protein SEA_TOMAS_266 [Streptomyces phage Tomas]